MTAPETHTPTCRYEIQHGPDGEADYAWIYAGDQMVATCRTHHAIGIVTAVNSFSTLQDRVAVLEGENARTQALFTAARKTSAALSGRVAELEEALKPFARIAEQRGKAPAGENVLVSIDMCRDARAALGQGGNSDA